MLTKIYAVMQADSDGAHIAALTLNKEKAERLVKLNENKRYYSNPWVEEYEDDEDYIPQDIKEDRYVYYPYADDIWIDNYDYDEVGVFYDDDTYKVAVYANDEGDAKEKAWKLFCEYKFGFMPPGKTISEMLQFDHYPLEDFAEDIGLTVDEVTQLINGEIPITQELAEGLSNTVGAPTWFWLELLKGE